MLTLQSVTFLAGAGIASVGVNTTRYDSLAGGSLFTHRVHHPRLVLARKMIALLRQQGWIAWAGVTEDGVLGVTYSRQP